MRVALLINIPAPYRLPFFGRLAEHTDLLVIFDARTEENRRWKIDQSQIAFAHSFATGITLPYRRHRADMGFADERVCHLKLDYGRLLSDFRPEIVVSAEFGLRTSQAALYCTLKRIPLIVWSEGTRHTEGWAGTFKTIARRLLVSRASRFWCNGPDSSQFLMDLGAPPQNIDQGMTGIDTESFHNSAQRASHDRKDVRRDLGISGVALLFVGQYTQRKGIPQYLKALERLHRAGTRDWTAIFVGSGDLGDAIVATQTRNPDMRLIECGFRSPSAIAELYDAADVFVLPTLDDNWSLVCLEAAICGLPQIFSTFNGATRDLAEFSAGQAIINPTCETDFYNALSAAINNPPRRLCPQKVNKMKIYYSVHELTTRAMHSLEAALRRAK